MVTPARNKGIWSLYLLGSHPDAPNSGFSKEYSTEIKNFIGPWNNPFPPHPLAASSVLLGFI